MADAEALAPRPRASSIWTAQRQVRSHTAPALPGLVLSPLRIRRVGGRRLLLLASLRASRGFGPPYGIVPPPSPPPSRKDQRRCKRKRGLHAALCKVLPACLAVLLDVRCTCWLRPGRGGHLKALALRLQRPAAQPSAHGRRDTPMCSCAYGSLWFDFD